MSQIKKPTVSRFTRLALAALSLAGGVAVAALFSAAPALAGQGRSGASSRLPSDDHADGDAVSAVQHVTVAATEGHSR